MRETVAVIDIAMLDTYLGTRQVVGGSDTVAAALAPTEGGINLLADVPKDSDAPNGEKVGWNEVFICNDCWRKSDAPCIAFQNRHADLERQSRLPKNHYPREFNPARMCPRGVCEDCDEWRSSNTESPHA